MSEFGDPRDEANGVSPAPNTVADRDPDQDLAASVAGDSVAGTNTATTTNPRKRKKSSRALVPLFLSSALRLVCMSHYPTSTRAPPTDLPVVATFAMSTINLVTMPSHGVAIVKDTTSRVFI